MFSRSHISAIRSHHWPARSKSWTRLQAPSSWQHAKVIGQWIFQLAGAGCGGGAVHHRQALVHASLSRPGRCLRSATAVISASNAPTDAASGGRRRTRRTAPARVASQAAARRGQADGAGRRAASGARPLQPPRDGGVAPADGGVPGQPDSDRCGSRAVAALSPQAKQLLASSMAARCRPATMMPWPASRALARTPSVWDRRAGAHVHAPIPFVERRLGLIHREHHTSLPKRE